ncbi:MAG: redoxin domain-containing protein, partial [Silvibacterium sp.]
STQNVMRLSCFTACLLFGVLTVAHVGSAWGSQVPYGYTLNGQPVTSLAPAGTEAIVLFFTATDCPISNRYIPEIQRLEKKYAAQHVVFWFVYPNVGETGAAVRQHEADYGTEAHVLLDPHHRLVDLTRARVTPEAAILVPQLVGAESLRTVYHGRIDNRYIQIGQQRPTATQFDLERAIVDVLQHRPVQRPDGPAVGCGIIGQ